MRKFMVVLDDSRECLNAMRFAALRAAHTGAGVQILSVIPPEEFQHWMGVAVRATLRPRFWRKCMKTLKSVCWCWARAATKVGRGRWSRR